MQSLSTFDEVKILFYQNGWSNERQLLYLQTNTKTLSENLSLILQTGSITPFNKNKCQQHFTMEFEYF